MRLSARLSAKAFEKLLVDLHACPSAKAFCKGKTLNQAWKTSTRGDWMLWLLWRQAGKPGWPTTIQFRAAEVAYQKFLDAYYNAASIMPFAGVAAVLLRKRIKL